MSCAGDCAGDCVGRRSGGVEDLFGCPGPDARLGVFVPVFEAPGFGPSDRLPGQVGRRRVHRAWTAARPAAGPSWIPGSPQLPCPAPLSGRLVGSRGPRLPPVIAMTSRAVITSSGWSGSSRSGSGPARRSSDSAGMCCPVTPTSFGCHGRCLGAGGSGAGAARSAGSGLPGQRPAGDGGQPRRERPADRGGQGGRTTGPVTRRERGPRRCHAGPMTFLRMCP